MSDALLHLRQIRCSRREGAAVCHHGHALTSYDIRDPWHINLRSNLLTILRPVPGEPRQHTAARFQPAFLVRNANERCIILTNYKKILRTGMLMSGLLVTGVALPAAAQNSMDQGTTTDHDRGFHQWGLLGLLGLAGLLGKKRDRDVVRTGRV